MTRVVTPRNGAVIRLGVRPSRGGHGTVVYRDASLAGGEKQVTLRFAYHALTASRHGLVPARQSWLEIDVVDPAAHRLLARVLRPGVPARQGATRRSVVWRTASFDLTRFHGRRLRLVFRDHQFAPGHAIILDLAHVRVTVK